MFTSLHLCLICFPCLALLHRLLWAFRLSLLGKTRCRRKRLMAYLPSLKLFLPPPSVEKFAKQANLVSHRVFVRVFLLCSSWMYFLMGLSKAINLFALCLWFMANFQENLSKLVETIYKLLWMKIEDAPKTTWMRLRTDWLILTADFWLDETAFPTCEKVDSRLWLDGKFFVWVFHAIDSIQKSK